MPTRCCVVNRDYIHIMDLADAHWRAIQYLQAGGQTAAFNLGNGGGYSVMQVIEAAEAVTGKSVPVQVGPRRAGDPARLVADATRARSVLGWQPQYAELETIVRHAWGWEQKAGC